MHLPNGCSAKEALKLMKNHFQEKYSSGKNTYANKSTDKRIVLLREYTSPIIFLESFHLT